ncbi:MAG TPA: type II toxin-antitoxin system prevent-host-death family antitoxin [bacterium]|nr:type II toxin-antitoxin system prevent-host-death family antitoxin [bacterium]
MTHIVEIEQAESQLAKLVQRVGAGDEVVITQHGQPVARIVHPIRTATQGAPDRVPGTAKGKLVVPDDFDAPLEDFREYM